MIKAKLLPNQYQDLKKFLDFFSTHFLPIQKLPADERPIAVLEVIERKSPNRANEALMMGINDCIELSMSWEITKIALVDAQLKSSGVVSLSELRHRYSRQYARVMKRKSVASVDEYYLLKGVLDGSTIEMTESEKDKIYQMLESYEKKLLANRFS